MNTSTASNQNISIPDLWKFPFPLTFNQLLHASPYLNQREKTILLELEELYMTKETIMRRGSSDLYHLHGVLSASTLAYTFNQWQSDFKDIDYLVLISAAVLHDFGGFVSTKKSFAESMNLLISAELLVLLGRPTVDAIYKTLKYASYGVGSPITWGADLLSDHVYDVKIEEHIDLSGLLLAYSDIVGQLASPSYKDRRDELVQLLDYKKETDIPIKIVALADLIIYTLEKRTNKQIPSVIKEGFKTNTASTRKFHNYKLMFESS